MCGWKCMKFDMHIGGSTADVPVKLQSDTIIQITNLAGSRFHDILRLLPGPRFQSLVWINNEISKPGNVTYTCGLTCHCGALL